MPALMYPFGANVGDYNGFTSGLGDCNSGLALITVNSGFPFFNAPFKDIYVSSTRLHMGVA
jgi:hypothetical protein